MKRKNKKLKWKKIIFAAFAAFEALAVNVPFVFAIGDGEGVDVPSPSEIAAELEERYHLNTRSMQDFGESMNVSNTKGTAPQVMVFFNPTNPKEGEKVTATAMPMYFSNANTKENLYFTWYLKRKGGSNSLSDQKLEAMKYAANGGWEPNLDRDGDGEDDPGFSVNDFYNSAPRDGDKDGYEVLVDKNNDDDFDDGNDVNKQGGADKEKMPKHCYFHDFTTGKNYEIAKFKEGGRNFNNPRCGTRNTDESSPRCGSTTWNYDISTVWDDGQSTSQETAMCVKAENDNPTCVDGVAECAKGQPVCGNSTAAVIDADTNCVDLEVPRCSSISAPTTTCEISGERRHLFARPATTGDGFFGRDERADGTVDYDEEKLFGTNPYDADTDDDGFVDEADAAGLGQDTISWIYQKGDKVGVAVEGTSMFATKYSDGSMMIMWAFLGNKCGLGTTGTYKKTIKGYTVPIPVTAKNLNNCLENNFVDPSEGGQPKKLEVNLSYFPESPVNDPTEDKMGDTLVVNSTIDTTGSDMEQIYYKWKISYKRRLADSSEEWKTVPPADVNNIKIRGNNLSSLKIPLNFPVNPYFTDGATYLKIRLEARENYQGTAIRSGYGEVIVRVINSSNKVEVYRTGVDNNGKFLPDGIICNDALSKAVCFVVKNEVVGLGVKKDIDENPGNDINNATWAVDGKPLECAGDVSSNCGTSGDYYYNYLPITKKTGERYTVNFQGLNVASGKNVELIRTLEVVEPFIEIISTDTNIAFPRFLGVYKNIITTNPDEMEIKNFSKDIFDVTAGTSGLRFQAVFHPAWIAKDSVVEWLVNGEKDPVNNIAESDGNGDSVNESMSYDTLKAEGEADIITFNARYNQQDEKRKAMSDIWGISPFDSTDKYMQASITANMVSDEEARKNPTGFFASLYFNLPANLIFMLKMAITAFLIIFISKLILSLNLGREAYNKINRPV